ncbi:MAG TPA: HAD-IA family hydrolase [Burkholderiales bacterium]|nr:HAD-IA family hydrolase [Burkholderiales bacterium]
MPGGRLNAEARYPLVVFDWDGTLMDSAAGIVESIQEAARDLGLPVPSADAARHVIGLGLHASLSSAVPELPAQRYPEFAEAYRRHFRARQDAMRPFAGVPEMLEALGAAGCVLAIATGKSRRGLDYALRATGLGRHFRHSRCADETQPKPHPAMLLELMRESGASPAQTVMVGDTSHDLGMARDAAVDAVAVTYGAHPGAALRALGPRACVGSVTELRQWLTADA